MSLNLVERPGGLIVVDVDSRFYIARRRSSGAYHSIQPAGPEHPLVVNTGMDERELVCSCPGGTYHGTCWATDLARAFETELAELVAWGIEQKIPDKGPGRVLHRPVGALPATRLRAPAGGGQNRSNRPQKAAAVRP